MSFVARGAVSLSGVWTGCLFSPGAGEESVCRVACLFVGTGRVSVAGQSRDDVDGVKGDHGGRLVCYHGGIRTYGEVDW